jgi:drug/metabolite transporter superfamily protein YnfA
MHFLRTLFSEKSDISMMRVMSLISLLIGGYLAVKGHDTSVSTFIYAAFGGKFIQKYIENKP